MLPYKQRDSDLLVIAHGLIEPLDTIMGDVVAEAPSNASSFAAKPGVSVCIFLYVGQ
jgi:hypothetical protein